MILRKVKKRRDNLCINIEINVLFKKHLYVWKLIDHCCSYYTLVYIKDIKKVKVEVPNHNTKVQNGCVYFYKKQHHIYFYCITWCKFKKCRWDMSVWKQSKVGIYILIYMWWRNFALLFREGFNESF